MSAQHFAVLDKVDLPTNKKDKIGKIISGLQGDTQLSFNKQAAIRSMLENSERWLTLRKTMDAGLQAGDIEIFSNVLSVVIPKFWVNTIIDKLVSIQPATTPYPIVYYVDFVYGGDQTADSLFGSSLQTPTHMDGYGAPTANQILRGQRSLTYGNVDEGVAGRLIKAVVRNESLTTTIKRINAEWTLESIIALASVMGLQDAANFVDQRLTNTIYTKLRDEVEWSVIGAMWDAVPNAHKADFTMAPASITLPTELHAYKKTFTETIENLSAKVFRIYGVKPN